MTKEIINRESGPKLKLYASNESEVKFLKDLYHLMEENNIACNYDKGNFHYGVYFDLKKYD